MSNTEQSRLERMSPEERVAYAQWLAALEALRASTEATQLVQSFLLRYIQESN